MLDTYIVGFDFDAILSVNKNRHFCEFFEIFLYSLARVPLIYNRPFLRDFWLWTFQMKIMDNWFISQVSDRRIGY